MAAIRHDVLQSRRDLAPRWEDRDEAFLHNRRSGFNGGRHLGFAGPGGATDGDAVTGI